MAGELDEEVELRPGQRHGRPIAGHRPAGEVDRQRAEMETLGVAFASAGPAQRGADACDELGDLERLRT